jgi:hypothetical protein
MTPVGKPLLLLLVALLSMPSIALGAPEAGVSESLATESIRITTDDDSVHAYVSAEPWPQGFIKAVRADGGVEFLPAHRIRKIQQVGEVDITERVLVDRKTAWRGDRETSPVRKNKDLTFRGYPYPETKWFFLLQTGILAGIDRDPNPAHLVFDFGVMRNLGPHWAAGINLHAQAGDVSGVGVILRGRRWLSRSISVDLGAGFLNPGDLPYLSTVWIGQAHLNLGNVASMTLEMDRWKRDDSGTSYYYVPPGLQDGVESGTSWKAGGTIGYLPGVVALAITYGSLILLYVAAYGGS